jgi:hypothetical protein
LTTKTHLVADGKGRALAFVLTGGQVADTTMRARFGLSVTMRSDKTARNHHSGQCLAATLHWVQTFSNAA